MTLHGQRVVLGCLLGLAMALLLVGVASGTLLRHIVQILPIIFATGVLGRRPDWGAYASLPIFVFWIVIVVLIWLFLLGVSRIANGHFTPVEIFLTFVMAGFSLVGAVRSVSLGKPLRVSGRALAIILFALIQVAAMWVSFLKPIATR
jgi:hypothetical protein